MLPFGSCKWSLRAAVLSNLIKMLFSWRWRPNFGCDRTALYGQPPFKILEFNYEDILWRRRWTQRLFLRLGAECLKGQLEANTGRLRNRGFLRELVNNYQELLRILEIYKNLGNISGSLDDGVSNIKLSMKQINGVCLQLQDVKAEIGNQYLAHKPMWALDATHISHRVVPNSCENLESGAARHQGRGCWKRPHA